MMKMESYFFYILLCFIIPAGCFQFRRTPTKPLVVYYKNRTNVELKWEWTMANDEVLALLKIKRYRKNYANTEVVVGTYYSSSNSKIDTTKYGLTVNNFVNGYASFVIKDLTNQGQGVNVMSENEIYVYKIVVDEQTQATEHDDEVELNVFRIPYITTYPRNQTASGGTITFECAAGGKPTPTITWEKIGSSQSLTPGSPLTITNFAEDKIGVYKCTARSTGIVESASATGSVQFATCGSGCNKQEFGIEFATLEFRSNANYQDLKKKIQTECLKAYALKNKIIHTCQVPRFRSGSLVAVVELGSPTNYVGDPKQPLLEAISDGNFAGYPVRNTFVSPAIPTVGQTQSSTRRLTRSSDVNVLDQCASNPCKNGGNCTDLGADFSCSCIPGWEGKDCSKNMGECASDPCKNGGNCTDLTDGFSCICTTGWDGKDCTIESTNAAAAVRCANNFIIVCITVGTALAHHVIFKAF